MAHEHGPRAWVERNLATIKNEILVVECTKQWHSFNVDFVEMPVAVRVRPDPLYMYGAVRIM